MLRGGPAAQPFSVLHHSARLTSPAPLRSEGPEIMGAFRGMVGNRQNPGVQLLAASALEMCAFACGHAFLELAVLENVLEVTVSVAADPETDPRVQEKLLEVLRVLVEQEPCSGYRDALEELLQPFEQAREG